LLRRAAVVTVARTFNNFFLAVVASHLASPCFYLRRLKPKSSLPLGKVQKSRFFVGFASSE
ncbi:MAG: hypothetical protein ACE1Z1_04280, partial [Candidatus Acidiferrales bacterium]